MKASKALLLHLFHLSAHTLLWRHNALLFEQNRFTATAMNKPFPWCQNTTVHTSYHIYCNTHIPALFDHQGCGWTTLSS